MRLILRYEGEVFEDGVNFNESIRAWYVTIRHGNNLLNIYIPKNNPQGYSCEEVLLNKWDQKLWS